MKPQLIAEFISIPSVIHSTVRNAKAIIAVAGAIALIGVVTALSDDTERYRTRFFLDNGSVLKATRLQGAEWGQVERAYPITRDKGDK